MTLSELQAGRLGVVSGVHDLTPGDSVSRRLRDLGFVAGETVRLVTRGPMGGEPLLVQVGFSRFAMRHAEAARINLQPQTA
ncbi:FeoA family protein [Arenimonas alkanexedens]